MYEVIVKPVVCDYGVFENGELKLILNSKLNVDLIKTILEIDSQHKHYEVLSEEKHSEIAKVETIDHKNINKLLETMDKWLKNVSVNNNHEINQTEKLRIILLNLKIVCADKKEIIPITDALAIIINDMHESTYKLVTEGRKELRQHYQKLKNILRKIKWYGYKK